MRKSWQYLAMATAVCAVAVTTVQAFQTGMSDQRLTRCFKDEKLSDVLAWMSLGKYSFVCADNGVQESRLNLDLKGVTLDEAMEAIAEQTQGEWIQKGNIFTLYPNASKRVPTQPVTFILGQPSLTPNPDEIEVPKEFNLVLGQFTAAPRDVFQTAANAAPRYEATYKASPFFLPATFGTLAYKQDKHWQDDFFNTSPMRDDPFMIKQDSKLEKEIRDTLTELRKLMPSIRGNQKLTPEQSAKLEKQLAAVEKKLSELLAKQNADFFSGQAFDFKMAPMHMPKFEEFKNFKFDSKGFQGMDPKSKAEMEKAMQEAMKAHQDAFKMLDSAEMKKLMELGKLNGDAFKGMQFDSKAFQGFKMDSKAKAEMEKAMQEATKAHQDAFKMLDSAEMKKLMELHKMDAFKGLDAKTKADIEKEMKAHQDAMKSMGDFKMDGKSKAEIEKAMKAHQDAMKSLDAKTKAEIEKAMQEAKKHSDMAMAFNGQKINFEKLVDSLTPKQKDLMKSKGYLTPADLSADQLKMLGKLPDGEYTISFSKDGKSIIIKSIKNGR